MPVTDLKAAIKELDAMLARDRAEAEELLQHISKRYGGNAEVDNATSRLRVLIHEMCGLGQALRPEDFPSYAEFLHAQDEHFAHAEGTTAEERKRALEQKEREDRANLEKKADAKAEATVDKRAGAVSAKSAGAPSMLGSAQQAQAEERKNDPTPRKTN